MQWLSKLETPKLKHTNKPVHKMEIFIIAILIIVAIIFMLIELFVIPGISFAGFAAFGCIFYAIYYAFVNIGVAG